LVFSTESPLFSLATFATFVFSLLCRLVEYIDQHRPKRKSFTLKSEPLSLPSFCRPPHGTCLDGTFLRLLSFLKSPCWTLANPFGNSGRKMHRVFLSHVLAGCFKEEQYMRYQYLLPNICPCFCLCLVCLQTHTSLLLWREAPGIS